MALIDIITQAGGNAAIEQLGARVGLSPDQTRTAAAALLPALAGGMRQQSGAADLGGLLSQAGLAPGAAPGGDTTAMGDQILGRIFGSKEVSRTVAADAASATGIDVGQLKALLPLLASLSAGALTSRAGAGNGAAGLMALLDQDGDGSPLNDIMGMAGKFLRR